MNFAHKGGRIAWAFYPKWLWGLLSVASVSCLRRVQSTVHLAVTGSNCSQVGPHTDLLMSALTL